MRKTLMIEIGTFVSIHENILTVEAMSQHISFDHRVEVLLLDESVPSQCTDGTVKHYHCLSRLYDK